MIEVSKKEILQFILDQPDDRKVSMLQAKSHDCCGCVMVHYGKEVLKLDKFGCPCDGWIENPQYPDSKKVAKMEEAIDDIILPHTWHEIQTYGQLKPVAQKQLEHENRNSKRTN